MRLSAMTTRRILFWIKLCLYHLWCKLHRKMSIPKSLICMSSRWEIQSWWFSMSSFMRHIHSSWDQW